MLHIKITKMSKKAVKIYLKECTVLMLNESLSFEERLQTVRELKKKEVYDGSFENYKVGKS